MIGPSAVSAALTTLAGVAVLAAAVGVAVPGAAAATTGSIELRASDLGAGWKPATAGSPPHSFEKTAGSSRLWLADSTVTAEASSKTATAQVKRLETDLREGVLLTSLTKELGKHGRHPVVSSFAFPTLGVPALGGSLFAYRESWTYVNGKTTQPELQDVISVAVGPLLITLTTVDLGALSPVPVGIEKTALSRMLARARSRAQRRPSTNS